MLGTTEGQLEDIRTAALGGRGDSGFEVGEDSGAQVQGGQLEPAGIARPNRINTSATTKG